MGSDSASPVVRIPRYKTRQSVRLVAQGGGTAQEGTKKKGGRSHEDAQARNTSGRIDGGGGNDSTARSADPDSFNQEVNLEAGMDHPGGVPNPSPPEPASAPICRDEIGISRDLIRGSPPAAQCVPQTSTSQPPDPSPPPVFQPPDPSLLPAFQPPDPAPPVFQPQGPSPPPVSAASAPEPSLPQAQSLPPYLVQPPHPGPFSWGQGFTFPTQLDPWPMWTIFIHSSGPWPPNPFTRWNRYDLHPATPIASLFCWEGRTRPDTGLREVGGREIEHYLNDVVIGVTRLFQSGWPQYVSLRPCERLPQEFGSWAEYLEALHWGGRGVYW